MEVQLKQVENGFVVLVSGEHPVDGFISKEYIFSRLSTALRFVRDTFSVKE